MVAFTSSPLRMMSISALPEAPRAWETATSLAWPSGTSFSS